MINNREINEEEFLGLIIYDETLLKYIQIKPRHLFIPENQKLLEQLISVYKNGNHLTPVVLLENFGTEFDIVKYTELMNNTLTTNHKHRFFDDEERIFNFYKEDVINRITVELQNKKITYNEFSKKMQDIIDTKLAKKSETLTIKELQDNLAEGQAINIVGLPKFNEFLKLVQGDFLIVGATTGTGKSSFLLNLMNALMHDYQCIYFNMEMSKSTIYKRMIAINQNLYVNQIINQQDPKIAQFIRKAQEDITSNGVIVEHQASDIDDIKRIVAHQKRDRHTIVFIDHLGLTKSANSKSLYEQMTYVAKEIRQMCLEYDCTVIGACQLNRTAYSSDDVNISMLKDSGELENSASKVVLLHRPNDNENAQVEMDIEIAKNRDGRLGIIKFNYDKSKQIFKEGDKYGH